jgi:hypothetical protein
MSFRSTLLRSTHPSLSLNCLSRYLDAKKVTSPARAPHKNQRMPTKMLANWRLCDGVSAVATRQIEHQRTQTN